MSEIREPGRSYAESWVDDRCREIIFAVDLPNGLDTVGDPTTYAIGVSNTIWPLSGSIKKKLEETGERRLTCSMSMSFYHFIGAKFFGSTFVGHEHAFTLKSVKNDTLLRFKNFNELVYFQTKVYDSNCFVVVELVVSLYDHYGDVVEKRYGCGFALISPFLSEFPFAGSTNVYEGSPRELLSLRGGSSIFEQLRKQETTVEFSYQVWRCENIGEVLKSSNLIKENQIVGARTRIAGLHNTTVNFFDDRGCSELPCIGAQTRGDVLDWVLSPPDSINLAPTQTLTLVFELTIPQRSQFEQACCHWVSNVHHNDEATSSRKASGIFGWGCSSPLRRKRSSIAITSRRLRVGIHNGHNIIKWHELYVLEDGSDVLKSSSPLQVHTFEDCSVMIVAEYICEEIADGRSMKSPKQSQHRSIVIGLTVIPPFDRAASNYDETIQITFDLINDARCNLLTPNTVFSPSNAPTCTLRCDVKMAKRVADETSQEILEYRRSSQSKSDSISLDGSSKSKFLRRKVANNDDISFTSFRDTSTLTFEESLFEEKEECIDDAIVSTPPEQVLERRYDCQPHTYSVLCELDDTNSNTTTVSIILKSFIQPILGGMRSMEMPKSLSLQLKPCENDEVTGTFPLKGTAFPEQSRLTFEYKISRHLILFMLGRDLLMDVFDDNRFHIGTVAMPMHLLLRQGKTTRSMENLSVDVVSPRGISYDDHVLRVDEGVALSGEITGRMSLSIELVGKKRPPPSDTPIPCSAKTRYARNLLDTNTDLRMLALKIRCTNENNSGFVNTDNGTLSFNVKSLQQRQLDAVEEFFQEYDKRKDKSESLFSFLIDSPQGSFHRDNLLLNAAKMIREKEKRKVIAAHVNGQNKETVISLTPFLGQSLLVEIEIKNYLAIDDCFAIKSSHSGLRIITSASEWESRRRAYGARILPGKEAFVQFACLQDDKVRMQSSQTLVVPLLLDHKTSQDAKITISFVSMRNNCVADFFLLSVQPWRWVDRRFIIPYRYNERITQSFAFHPQKTNHSNILAIKVIKKTPNEVRWGHSLSRDSEDESVDNFTLTCDRLSSTEEIYVALSDDQFNSILECWEMRFEPRCPVFETVALGAKIRKEILVKGCTKDRLLRCRAMTLPNQIDAGKCMPLCQCQQDTFQLKANQVSRFELYIQCMAVGTWNSVVNCVDEETGELVQSFLLTVQCHLPVMLKVCSSRQNFHVNVKIASPISPRIRQGLLNEVVPGQAKQIELPFTNCLHETPSIEISCSNELIVNS